MIMQNIYFAGGCFWGVEEYFSRIPGVCDTECGYANGTRSNPTYEEVCSDTTGFAETVRIMYNPDIVALRILVRQFFKIIDPVSVNRQGNDRGSQYRTGIYYTSDEDRGPLRLHATGAVNSMPYCSRLFYYRVRQIRWALCVFK